MKSARDRARHTARYAAATEVEEAVNCAAIRVDPVMREPLREPDCVNGKFLGASSEFGRIHDVH